MLGWMVEDKHIAPHAPVWDRTERKDGTLSSSEFVWDEQANEYRCPQGHALLSDRRQFSKPRDRITKAGTILYSASQHDCTGCAMKQQCCPNMPNRRIMRSVHERSREVAREIANMPQKPTLAEVRSWPLACLVSTGARTYSRHFARFECSAAPSRAAARSSCEDDRCGCRSSDRTVPTRGCGSS